MTWLATGWHDPKMLLFLALGVVAVLHLLALGGAFVRARRTAAAAGGVVPAEPILPDGKRLATGFVTDFFDTLGIGSFAPTTSLFRFFRLVPDERIPGTLNVGHSIPTILEAYIYTRIIPVEARTLLLLIGAAVVGAWLGAGVVSRWSRRRIQLGMGLCLLGAAAFMLASLANLLPAGGELTGISGTRLGIAIAGHFALGAFMTLGIGLYAPSLILVSLLGMNPTAAFPIMMGSCAFLMPVSGFRFIRAGSFDLRASLGLLLGGLPAVLIAAFLVKSLPLTAVRWLVVVVVVYTAAALLRAARRGGVAETGAAPKVTDSNR